MEEKVANKRGYILDGGESNGGSGLTVMAVLCVCVGERGVEWLVVRFT